MEEFKQELIKNIQTKLHKFEEMNLAEYQEYRLYHNGQYDAYKDCLLELGIIYDSENKLF